MKDRKSMVPERSVHKESLQGKNSGKKRAQRKKIKARRKQKRRQ